MRAYIESEEGVRERIAKSLVDKALGGLRDLDLFTADIEKAVSDGNLEGGLRDLTVLFEGLTNGVQLGWRDAEQQIDIVSDITNQVRQARNIRAGRLGSEDG